MDSPLGSLRARLLLRSGVTPPMGSPQEWFLYEAERRERRVEILRTQLVAMAALKDAKGAESTYFELLELVFPEQGSSRRDWVERTKEILELESKKTYRMTSPKLRRNLFERLDDLENKARIGMANRARRAERSNRR